MEKKSIRIGILAYCITQSSPRYKNCSEVRKMFKSGAALYQKEIATKDINDLKVTTYLVLLYILNRLCCPIWCHTSSKYLITGEMLFPPITCVGQSKNSQFPRLESNLRPSTAPQWLRWAKPSLDSKVTHAQHNIILGSEKSKTSISLPDSKLTVFPSLFPQTTDSWWSRSLRWNEERFSIKGRLLSIP